MNIKQSSSMTPPVRNTIRSEKDFVDGMCEAYASADADRINDFFGRLNLPKEYEVAEKGEVSPAAADHVVSFDHEFSTQDGVGKFVERHVRKLKWHATHPALEGIAGTQIIYSALGFTTDLRVRRVINLLKPKEVLTAHEWGQARELLNRAYRDYRLATHVMSVDWLEALFESCDKAQARAALEGLPAVLKTHNDNLTRLREEVERIRQGLAVQPVGYPLVKPPRYFGGDLLDQASWKHFWGEVGLLADHVRQYVG